MPSKKTQVVPGVLCTVLFVLVLTENADISDLTLLEPSTEREVSVHSTSRTEGNFMHEHVEMSLYRCVHGLVSVHSKISWIFHSYSKGKCTCVERFTIV